MTTAYCLFKEAHYSLTFGMDYYHDGCVLVNFQTFKNNFIKIAKHIW